MLLLVYEFKTQAANLTSGGSARQRAILKKYKRKSLHNDVHMPFQKVHCIVEGHWKEAEQINKSWFSSSFQTSTVVPI